MHSYVLYIHAAMDERVHTVVLYVDVDAVQMDSSCIDIDSLYVYV